MSNTSEAKHASDPQGESPSASETQQKAREEAEKAFAAPEPPKLKLVEGKPVKKRPKGRLLVTRGLEDKIHDRELEASLAEARTKQPQAAAQPPQVLEKPAPADLETATPLAAAEKTAGEKVAAEIPPSKKIEPRESRAGIEPQGVVVVRTRKGLEVREVPLSDIVYSGTQVFVRQAGALRPLPGSLSVDQQAIFRRIYLKDFCRQTTREKKIEVLKQARDFFEVLREVAGKKFDKPAEIPEELRDFEARLASLPALPEVASTPTSDDFLEGDLVVAEVSAANAVEQAVAEELPPAVVVVPEEGKPAEAEASAVAVLEPVPPELVKETAAPAFDDYVRVFRNQAATVGALVRRGILIGELQQTRHLMRDEAIQAAVRIEKDLQAAAERVEVIAKKTGGPEKEVAPKESALEEKAWEEIVAGREREAALTGQEAEDLALRDVVSASAERVGKEGLVKSWLRQAAERLAQFRLFGLFRKKGAKAGKPVESAVTGAEAPEAQKVPQGFAAAVAQARQAADNPRLRFLRERLKGALTMSWLEWRQAEAFRYRTNQIAVDIAKHYSGAAERYRNNELFQELLIDSALGQLRERLGKLSRFGQMRTYRGEKTAEVLEQRLEQIKVQLKTELAQAVQENKLIDGRELAKALRENIDPEYWKRYIWGSAELALAAGGAALVWLKPASAAGAEAVGAKLGTKAAVRSGREVVKAVAESARHAAELEAPSSPAALENSRVISRNIWDTVRQWYLDHGVNPSNRQILAAGKEIARANDVSVPEWNISGSLSARRLATGLVLKGFGKLAREIAENI